MGNTASGQPVPQPMMRSKSSFDYPTSSKGSAFSRQSDRALLTAELQRLVDEQEKERQKLMQANPNVKAISAKISELEAKKQPLRAQFEKLPMLAGEQRFMQQREQAMRPAVSVSGGSTTAKPEAPGLLSRLGRGAMDALQDPVRNAQIVSALNSLRFQPDPQLSKMMQARAVGVQESRRQAGQANRTAEYFRKRGQPEIADLIQGNPDIAATAVTAMFKDPATDPSILREYQFAVTQNPDLSYEEFLALKRTAGASVTVEGDQRDYAAEAYAKAIPERFDQIVDRGTQARRQLSDLTVLGSLLEGKETGGRAQTKARVMQFADSLGIPVNEGELADLQSIQAVSSRLVAEELRLNKGPQTDFDAEFTGRFLPGLGQRPEANKAIIDYMNSRNLLDAVLGRYVTDNRKYTAGDNALLTTVEGFRTQLGSVIKIGEDFVTFKDFYDENRKTGASDQQILEAWEREHRK